MLSCSIETNRWKESRGWKQHVSKEKVSSRAEGNVAFLWAFEIQSSEVLTILPERPYGMLDLQWIIQGDKRLETAALIAMRASSFHEPLSVTCLGCDPSAPGDLVVPTPGCCTGFVFTIPPQMGTHGAFQARDVTPGCVLQRTKQCFDTQTPPHLSQNASWEQCGGSPAKGVSDGFFV